MADPAFNDYYYLPGPEEVAGNPVDFDYGAPDSEGTGISVAMTNPTLDNSTDGAWERLD